MFSAETHGFLCESACGASSTVYCRQKRMSADTFVVLRDWEGWAVRKLVENARAAASIVPIRFVLGMMG